MLQKLRGSNSKGFTLIELMIVIAIIGILAAIAIPNYISYRDKAYCSSAETDVDSVMAAIADYFSDPNNMSVTEVNLAYPDGVGGELSNANTYVITGTSTAYTVTVTDASARCPRFPTNTIQKTM
jgi:prepilin-type N-terminal cleavage/methylation domain-containing protein